MNSTTKLMAVCGVVALLITAASVQAKGLRVQQEAPVPETGAVVVADCDTCCAPKYCIVYRNHHVGRKVCCDPCLPAVQTILQVQDPCTCCPIEVPVCVPGCCTDAPCVTTRCGLFGRTITEYTWCCGFKVRIVMTKRDTIIVHTYGS